MKARIIRLSVATAAAVILIVAGTSSYEKLTRLDLYTGNLRVERKLLGVTYHTTLQRSTNLTLTSPGSVSEPDWFTVERSRADFSSHTRGDQGYTRLNNQVFKVVQMATLSTRSLDSPMRDLTARLTLAELSKSHDVHATTKHLERVWLRLLDSDVADWPEDEMGTNFRSLWDKTAADPTSP